MKFLKKNKGKIIAFLIVILLLTFSYEWGTDVPDESAMTKVTQDTTDTEQEPVLKETEEDVTAEEQPLREEKEEIPVIKDEKKEEHTEISPIQSEAEYSVQQKMISDKENTSGEYETPAIPEGKPAPIEPQNVTISDKEYTCTLSVRCDTALKNRQLLDSAKIPLLPSDGVILPPTEVTFYEGESVFNLLLREMKRNKIHMEYVNTPFYNSAYIEGINNLYEFDCGELSGWMYKVNGWFPPYGCSRYQLRSGDSVEWVYTCNLGRDVGENFR